MRSIAGSVRPEEEGCFLCRDRWEADWFVAMNNTGGPVDIWAIEDVNSANWLMQAPGTTTFRDSFRVINLRSSSETCQAQLSGGVVDCWVRPADTGLVSGGPPSYSGTYALALDIGHHCLHGQG